MTRNNIRGVCRMRDLLRDIRYTHDLKCAMKENHWDERIYVSLSDAA